MREGLEQEFKLGTYNLRYDKFFPPVFEKMKGIELLFCDSSQRPRRKQRGIKFETPQGAGYLTLAAVAKCLQAVTWLVARGNKVDSDRIAAKWLLNAVKSKVTATIEAAAGDCPVLSSLVRKTERAGEEFPCPFRSQYNISIIHIVK